MKNWKCIVSGLVTVLLSAVMLPAASQAAFDSGSTGVDGDFAPTASTALEIPESGVFNFGTVNIPSGVTVTFTKNSANTPVTILATGDVTIAGTVSVNGSNATSSQPGAGGPGGFSGGIGGYVSNGGFRGQGAGGGGGGTALGAGGSGGGGGFGVGGGSGDLCATYTGGSTGVYCQSSGNGAGGAVYGNAGLIPLIGGSGGGGGAGTSTCVSGPGGGGGGAILIASSGTIRINGSITANGGYGTYANGYTGPNNNTNATFNAGGGGSGGAIRIVANVITGEGTISAVGGSSQYYQSYINNNNALTYRGGTGSVGRIRLEAWQITRSANTSPAYSSLLYPVAPYPAALPSLAITQINGVNVPSVTYGAYKSPDVTLPYNTTGPVTITVSAQNIPVGTTVTVKALPESGSSILTASGTLAGTGDSSSVQVEISTSSGTAYVLSASANL